jgi:hypothetical protein
MDQKTFSIAAGVIFAVVALFHLVRIYMGWPVMIGDWSVPLWLSWIRPHHRRWPRFFRDEPRNARCTLTRLLNRIPLPISNRES